MSILEIVFFNIWKIGKSKEVPDNENDISAEETFQSEGSRIQSKNEYSWRKKSFSSQKIKRKKAVISVGRIFVAFSSRLL